MRKKGNFVQALLLDEAIAMVRNCANELVEEYGITFAMADDLSFCRDLVLRGIEEHFGIGALYWAKIQLLLNARVHIDRRSSKMASAAIGEALTIMANQIKQKGEEALLT